MTISGVKKQLNEDFFDIDANENQTINAVELKYKLNKINKLIKDLKKQLEQVYSISLGELIENQHEFDGFLNCSEQGHINTPGNPFDGLKLNSNQWSFDVIYTPAMTTFLKNSENSGAKIITGIDLFLFQGIESFIIFTQQEKLRKKIMSNYDNIREYYFKKLIT